MDFAFFYYTDQSKISQITVRQGTAESTSTVDSSVPVTRHDPKDLGLIC